MSYKQIGEVETEVPYTNADNIRKKVSCSGRLCPHENNSVSSV